MKALALVLLFVAVYAKHEEYIGWKSYYVAPSTLEEVKALGAMVPRFQLDFVSHATISRQGVVLVKPRFQAGFNKALQEKNIKYTINSKDLKAQLDVDDQRMEMKKIKSMARGSARIPYDNYQTIDVIDEYLQEIAEKYPDVATLVTPANSFEDHPIQYLKISSSNFEDTSKPVIVLTSGINAREWIGPPTVTYAIHKLVEDLTEADLVEKFDWILLPVVNPDGYNYTSIRRFWHKTRSTDQHVLSPICPGVDVDLNFDFEWNTVGTSNLPCADNYPGSVPFSEMEARIVKDIIEENLERITLYISMHSYGSLILYPWGHDGSLSGNAFALHTVGITMANAITEKALDDFPKYVVGNSYLVTGEATSGSSEDYAQSLGVPLTYSFELPGLDEGLEGFNLDPEFIEQVCEETWAAVVVGARRSAELFGQ